MAHISLYIYLLHGLIIPNHVMGNVWLDCCLPASRCITFLMLCLLNQGCVDFGVRLASYQATITQHTFLYTNTAWYIFSKPILVPYYIPCGRYTIIFSAYTHRPVLDIMLSISILGLMHNATIIRISSCSQGPVWIPRTLNFECQCIF